MTGNYKLLWAKFIDGKPVYECIRCGHIITVDSELPEKVAEHIVSHLHDCHQACGIDGTLCHCEVGDGAAN